MGRLRNCIVALAEQKVLLYDTSIQYTYDASLKYEVRMHEQSFTIYSNYLFNHTNYR